MKSHLKNLCIWVLVLTMILPGPMTVFGQVNYQNLDRDKDSIINGKAVNPAKLKEGQTAEDLIKNPDQPAIYTLRTDYKVQKGEKYEVDYQPYIASVGAAASPDEQKKVKKEITLPDLAGYDKSHLDDSYTINYDTVKDAADGKNKTGNTKNGIRYQAKEEFRYKAKANQIKIKHLFQDMKDFTKYTNPGGDEQPEKITTQAGNTGSTMEVSPLNEVDRRGFVPEADYITMQVPEDATDFVLEYRYNRAHYNVDFDTKGGTPLSTRTYYYDQEIPKIEKENVPTKTGCDFLGWKPSRDLKDINGKDYKAGHIITKADGNPALDLDAHLKMPALLLGNDEQSRERLTFTAEWKDKPKADYAIQFWVEKSDHADDATLLNKYDYMGTRVYKQKDTGSTPDLDKEPVKGLKFPDLDDTRLQKIWNNATFNRGLNKFIDKFYVYNKDLTHEQNKDPKTNVTKTVSATGKTVYNIYYDRQVYDLYFTKSNALSDENTFYPEIYGRDQKKNELVKLGGPGNLYHYKARFNELMYGWPNDAMQTKGFTEGYQSFGWGPNYTTPKWPVHLDTPPYRLNAEQFLDMAKYDDWGGYVDEIDNGAGGTIKAKDFRTLSFGIKQDKPSIPHHMDFWMDGFKKGETIIRYDLVRTKADTADPQYTHKYPKVTGFTANGQYIREENQEDGRVNSDRIDELNDEREEITPYPGNGEAYYNIFGFNSHVGELKFIPAFFSNADEFGDPLAGEKSGFKENGYLQFHYTRNKYPLRFNYDPSIIRDDTYFKATNQLDTFYEFPLKVLSPDLVDSKLDRDDKEYFKEDPKNLLDNPENLQKLGLTDLVFTDKDGKLKVKRPDNLSDQMVFKGWALDPAGTKLIWENPKETMPFHPLNLYAKWGEPDYKWKVTFDPDGGKLKAIKEEKLTTDRKKIQEGDIGQEEVNTYAKKEANEGDKQVFTVIQRQKLVKPVPPVKKGYDFMGWEVIRYKKDEKGDYTDEVDTSYHEKYGVPELYTFGNDVVGPITLKAIWNPNQRVDVKVEHYMLDKDYNLKEKLEDTLEDKRANYLVATTGDKQDEKYILVPHSELEEKLTGDLKTTYEEYNERVKLNNSFFQTFRVEPEKILNTETNQMEENPKAKNNVFKFFYRPFRQREYTVNYIDERFKGKETEKGAAIIDPELVVNGNRHYDARNYRPIPGWVLAEGEKPQQQLFFDVDEDTNAFLGINGTGKKEITFYYKDVRVIEVPKDGKTPEGYVRVTFKADKGGSFTDKDGKSVTELHYDVIKGLKSDLLPVPKELEEGKEKADGKYYVTPDDGKKFVKWDEQPLLNKNTIINENHTFTAYFEWSGLSAKGLVTTESFKEDNGQWINNFAPTIDQLKKQLVWKEKDVEKPLPADATVKIVDETGKELTDQDVYNLVNEKKAFDKDELVRTVNFKAVVNFKDGKNEEKLDIPVKIYKNVYEALTGTDKPKFLSDAEKGELKDITGDYVKVTVNPTGKPGEKDSKVYYVNPKAWVNIPEIILTEEEKANLGFTNWTADQAKQNENKEANGIYDFTKRHKFTDKETVISPGFSKDVVEQKQGEDKPKVPDNYVKVIVKTTDKATSELTETFWVNPTKEVTLPVADPTGKADQEVDIPKLGKKKVTYVFKEWQKVQTGEAEDKLTEVKPAEKIDLAKNQYTTKVTIVEAAYNERFAATPIVKPIKTDELHTPEGKEITNDDLIKQITPQKGKEIESITVVERPDPSKPGKTEAKVTIKYKDGSSQGTDKDPVIIPVEVHKNIIPEAPGGQRPKDAMDNYVKVIFKAGTGGSLSGNLVYYVSPEVEVNMTESADKITKTPSTGYISGDWDTSETKKLKAKFTANETEFIFNFTKSEDIVEKIDENTKKPDGYVEVIFKTEDENKGKIEGNVAEKIYYVNPTAEIKLVKLAEGQTAGEKQLTVPKTLPAKNYVFDKWYEDIDTTNSITSERIHVAKFLAGQVSLTYKAGEGATGQVPEKVTVNYGTSVSLARPEGLSKANATFAGWKLDGEDKIYQPGDQVKLEKARTATAQWTTAKHTVTFNSMGGSDVPKQVVDHEKTATNPEAPKLDGKVFMGWKENASDENYFDFTTQIIEDKTLMAIWQAPVQKINNTDTVEEQFIKVTFQEGEHGQLVPDKDKQDEKVATVTYKVAKDYDFDKAVKAGLVVPEIVPAKYYKAKTDNQGWNTELKLEGANAVFTAQYEPIADVIPVDPQVTDETQIENEKPEGMVLVTFTVDENKAFMVGDTKFYVKANTKVDIPTPVVHPMTFENDEPNDYEFKGWSYDKDEDGEYNFIFTKDTNIDDGQLVKPIISIRYPRSNATIVYVSEITDRATGYIEIIRGSGSPVLIEAVNNDDGDIVFKVPAQLGGKLKRRDIIRAYSKLDNIQSDIREYRVR